MTLPPLILDMHYKLRSYLMAYEAAAHDHKGFSEEKCVRCGWVMGQPALNCQNDGTPHRFPSQSASPRFEP